MYAWNLETAMLTILPQNSAEAERAQSVDQRGSSMLEHEVLQTDSERAGNGDEEKPEGDTVGVVGTLLRVGLLESSDTLGVNNTE